MNGRLFPTSRRDATCVECGARCYKTSRRCRACFQHRKPVLQRKDGYRMLYLPEHPEAHKGYVYEHRVVAERKIGRPLRKGERVHHVNENRADNRPENLEVMTHTEHLRHHLGKGPSDEEGKELILAGYTTRQLATMGVWQHRSARLRRELREAGVL